MEETFRNEELTIVDSLVQLSFQVQAVLARAGAEHDLSIIQIRLLGILRDREPSMQQLAQHLRLDKSSITGLIDRAERRGLVERVASPHDRRGFLVKVTAEGWRLIDTVGGEIVRQIEDMAQVLPEEERLQFAKMAAKMLAYSGQQSPDAKIT
ncbi:MarR family transcriptional regulator [Paenibacillus oryzisoli]|uniref:MarR family winged helix-turn-helix transcriptional regulator n=1 Tax=Paenibacillus oryzisoli TaxID=1850517 RepID=UPI003D29D693